MGRKKRPVKVAVDTDSDEDSDKSEAEDVVESDKEEDTKSEKSSDSGDDSDEEKAGPTIPMVQVELCPVCTFPFEYCEYAGMMDQCKPHLMEWMKRKAATSAEDGAEGGDLAELSLKDKVKPKKKNPEGIEKMLPGGKVKKKEENIVLITVASRQKRKCVTTVTGLDLFGLKLSDAAKEFKKMFSCGASVVKTASGKEQIDIQGEFRDQLLEMWAKKFKTIPKSAVFTMDEGKNKVAAFE